QLSKGDRAVHVRDDLEIDVRDHVHARSQHVKGRRTLLVWERSRQDVDAVRDHGSDDEIAPDLELDDGGPLELSLHLTALRERAHRYNPGTNWRAEPPPGPGRVAGSDDDMLIRSQVALALAVVGRDDWWLERDVDRLSKTVDKVQEVGDAYTRAVVVSDEA